MVTKLKLLEGRAVIPPVGGEILVKRRSESETDHGNVAAKRDDQARQEQLRMRRRIARGSSHRASGGRDTRCNSPRIPSACAPGPRRSRKIPDQDTPPDRSDQPFDERMRDRSVRNRLDLLDLQHAQIGEPTVKAKERIVIGTEVFRLVSA